MEANEVGIIPLVAAAILINFLWVAATQIDAANISPSDTLRSASTDQSPQEASNETARLAKPTRHPTLGGKEESAASIGRQTKRDSNKTPVVHSERECQKRALVTFMIYRHLGLAKGAGN